MELAEYEAITPNIEVDGMIFIVPNTHCAWRINTLYTKEPDTIEWINNMKAGETLFDVGANIGQYTVYAAMHGIHVHAFEPEAQNFALLCRNIAINKLTTEWATPWPIALSDHPSIDVIHLSSCMAGGSCHSFGVEVDYHGKDKPFPYHHGSVASTLDIFAAKYGKPDHIKIDVDGFEHLVVEGAACTLRYIKSILIELNTAYPQHRELIDKMHVKGFHYLEAQAESSRRKEGPFKGVGNIIFYKDKES